MDKLASLRDNLCKTNIRPMPVQGPKIAVKDISDNTMERRRALQRRSRSLKEGVSSGDGASTPAQICLCFRFYYGTVFLCLCALYYVFNLMRIIYNERNHIHALSFNLAPVTLY